MPKPVKRVMFQEPLDDGLYSSVEERPRADEIEIPLPGIGAPIISVDGSAQIGFVANRR